MAENPNPSTLTKILEALEVAEEIVNHEQDIKATYGVLRHIAEGEWEELRQLDLDGLIPSVRNGAQAIVDLCNKIQPAN